MAKQLASDAQQVPAAAQGAAATGIAATQTLPWCTRAGGMAAPDPS